MTAGAEETECPAGRGAAQMISRARTAARDKARAADREAAKDGNKNVYRSSLQPLNPEPLNPERLLHA